MLCRRDAFRSFQHHERVDRYLNLSRSALVPILNPPYLSYKCDCIYPFPIGSIMSSNKDVDHPCLRQIYRLAGSFILVELANEIYALATRKCRLQMRRIHASRNGSL